MEGQIPPPAPAAQANLTLDNKQQAQMQAQQQLFKLPVGAQFNAAVVGGDKNGNAIIKFGGNDLILSSPIALSKGAQLALKVDGTSGSITLQLLSVDGKLPPTQAQAAGNQLQNPAPQGTPQGQGQNQQLPIIKVLSVTPQAVGNTANPQAQATQGQAVQGSASTQAAVVIGSASTASARGIVLNPVPEALQTIRASITSSVPPDQANKLLQNIPSTLKSGSEVSFKISNIQPPVTSQSNVTAPQNAAQNPADAKVHTDNKALANQTFTTQGQGQNQTPSQQTQQVPPQIRAAFTPNIQTAADGSVRLNALVVGVNSSSQLVVETAMGKLSVSTSVATNKVEIGSIMNLQLSGFGKIPSEAAQQPQNPVQALASDWPALRELAQITQAQGQNNTLSKLAGLDSIFASRLIAFMGAVKENNVHNWLSSQLMDVLDEATREQIIGKLRGDFSTMNRLLNDNPSNSWQTLLFPVYDGEELHQARLHLKYLEDEEGEIDKNAGSRFLVEFEASYFGEMQLDGLVRKHKAGSNFDLVIRTHKELDLDVRNDITTIFNNMQELTGFKGTIDFAANKEFPHRPMDERLSHDLHSDGSIQA